jgi:hypothetical protein
MDLKDFLKKYSSISNKFIDDFFSLYDTSSTSHSFVINFEVVADWLKIRKGDLKSTLVSNYIKDTDYTLQKVPSTTAGRPKEKIMLTPDCFKLLCMQSRSANSAMVRQYFLQVEETLDAYKNHIVADLQNTVEVLQNEQKPKIETTKGVIYGLRADKTRPEMMKLGKAKSFNNRLTQHNTSRVDDVEVLFIRETEDIDQVESCIKVALKKEQYKRRREIYEIDVDQLKAVFNKCNKLILFTNSKDFRHKKNGGEGKQLNTFIMIRRK